MFTPFSIDSFMIASWALRVAHLLQYESIAERNNVYYFHSPRPRALPMGVVKRPLPSERVVEGVDEEDIQSVVCEDEEVETFGVVVSVN